MHYKRGDVVLMSFPYAQDFSITKKRPALVISSPENPSEEITVVMITSVRKAADIPLRDWQTAKLLYPSFVRAKFVTIDPALILRQIGRITTTSLSNNAESLLWLLASQRFPHPAGCGAGVDAELG
jgi:mRNA-degrading endonuclease toxin of MazEF toxin-antitoxin module